MGIFDHEFELKDANGGSYKTSLGQCPPGFEDIEGAAEEREAQRPDDLRGARDRRAASYSTITS